MSKGLSLWFAFSSIVLLTVTAITISYNGWLATLLFVLSMANIVWGFIIRAKKNVRKPARLPNQPLNVPGSLTISSSAKERGDGYFHPPPLF